MGRHFRIITCIFFLVLTAERAGAQEALVTGRAEGAAGHMIAAGTFSDYISGKEIILARGRIDSAGNFSLRIPLKSTSYVWFNIDYYYGEACLEPGGEYQFRLCKLVFSDLTDRINHNLQPLVMQVVPDSNDALNLSIQHFNRLTNRFLQDNLIGFAEKRMRKAIDTLKMKCDTIFADFRNDFFMKYREYRFADLYLMNAQSSTSKLFETYLSERRPDYRNIEYMNFFIHFYEDYYMNIGQGIGVDKYRLIVNHQASWSALLDSAGADPQLVNEILREAVMLETLKNLYAAQGFDRKNILHMLRQAADQTKFEEHRLIANNLMEVLTRFEPGEEAPDFCLPGAGDDTLCLKQFRGKYVYLHFFTTWNIASLEEMEMMRSLYTKYKGNVSFISICCDREYMKMFHFARDHDYPWPLLHFSQDYEFLREWGIATYPYFILLDPSGRFVAHPAESPSMNIEKRLKDVLIGTKE